MSGDSLPDTFPQPRWWEGRSIPEFVDDMTAYERALRQQSAAIRWEYDLAIPQPGSGGPSGNVGVYLCGEAALAELIPPHEGQLLCCFHFLPDKIHYGTLPVHSNPSEAALVMRCKPKKLAELLQKWLSRRGLDVQTKTERDATDAHPANNEAWLVLHDTAIELYMADDTATDHSLEFIGASQYVPAQISYAEDTPPNVCLIDICWGAPQLIARAIMSLQTTSP